ncbi:ATP-binding protein [Alkalihalobacterium chitinilyticum]|uniref:histidine kinase n=1 Tax=Alkalihalobacterium chitinilyticum TaxID=2980103 RepID=A0ABT5VAA4_9BACI|nr:sensor histidine kinase [Alkalihalobacterium chitinilyticum]MDE5412215.1 sensor histidine kinase [Alkalihalobacterium chitinilyticum]
MKALLQLPIRWKITGLSFGIVAFSLIIIGIILLGYVSEIKEEERSQQAMITAQLVAQNQTVQDSIELANASEILQPLIERMRVLNEQDYIVILNMDRIRLTHPIPERLGTPFVGGDEGAAFAEHIYISKAKAEDGTETVRAFVPIINRDREQVGVVVVGSVLPYLSDIIYEFGRTALIIILITTLFGFWGAWLLANHIKKQTFEMEPSELARVLEERTATFNAIHDGVIAIDEHQRITVINEAAKRMLNVHGNVVGKQISDVIPDTRLPEILEIGQPVYQREFYVQNRAILSNRIPITDQGRTIGAVAIFQDKTEVNRLAKELTGVQAFVDALRVQNHEYSNKLHTIAGLIQLNQGNKALDYIFELNEEHSALSRILMQQIHDDSIVGLLLGKVSRGKELGISLKINKSSSFVNYPEGITNHDLVVIIGNLIDNSYDALLETDTSDKTVYILVKELEEELFIQVSDNGIGIPKGYKERIFTRGFSTKKKEGRGIGLFLIQSIVERVNGTIDIDSEENEGTTISITLPLKREDGVGHAL